MASFAERIGGKRAAKDEGTCVLHRYFLVPKLEIVISPVYPTAGILLPIRAPVLEEPGPLPDQGGISFGATQQQQETNL